MNYWDTAHMRLVYKHETRGFININTVWHTVRESTRQISPEGEEGMKGSGQTLLIQNDPVSPA